MTMLLSLLDRLFGGKIATTAMAFGLVAYRHGDRQGGARLVRVAAAAAPKDVALQCQGAAAAAGAGDHAMALQLLERALRVRPEDRSLVVQAALAQRALGDDRGAAMRCEEALARIPEGDPGYALMALAARLRMPGPEYLDYLAMIHGWLRPRAYVEIGVAGGNSIALAGPGTRAIGIDPAPEIGWPLPPNITVFKQTSDEFFASHDLRRLLDGLPVDLAFIDGMHRFEFALRDFVNLEKHCHSGATMLLDDCCPFDRRSAQRERATQFWTGDVWRIIPALRKYRPGLRIHTIATAPTGLCVLRGLDPGSRVLEDNFAAIVKEFLELDYSEFDSRRSEYLNPCPNQPERVRQIVLS